MRVKNSDNDLTCTATGHRHLFSVTKCDVKAAQSQAMGTDATQKLNAFSQQSYVH